MTASGSRRNRQSKEVARVQKFIDRFRYQANKASQVQSRIKQLEKVKLIERQRDTKRVRFKFPLPSTSGRQVLELRDVAKSYGEKVIYRSLDFSVEQDNGSLWSARTEPANLRCSRCLPESWRSRKGTRGRSWRHAPLFCTTPGGIAQPGTFDSGIAGRSVHAGRDEFSTRHCRSLSVLGQDQKKPIKALSGGERNRVALARMLVEPANTLLLDEPTNHLDPASVDMLTDALTDFPGTILFISHDPTFLTRIATRMVEIDEGNARNYFGDYEYFLWKKAQEFQSIKETSEELSSKSTGKSGAPTKAMLSQTEPKVTEGNRRELTKTQARLEKQVTRSESDIAGLDANKVPGPGIGRSGALSGFRSLARTTKRAGPMEERTRAHDGTLGIVVRRTGGDQTEADRAELNGGPQGLFEVVVQPAILFLRHQFVPDHTDQITLFPGLRPRDSAR